MPGTNNRNLTPWWRGICKSPCIHYSPSAKDGGLYARFQMQRGKRIVTLSPCMLERRRKFRTSTSTLQRLGAHQPGATAAMIFWRRTRIELRVYRLCRPLHNHSAIAPRPRHRHWIQKRKAAALEVQRQKSSELSTQPWQGCALPPRATAAGEVGIIRANFSLSSRLSKIFFLALDDLRPGHARM